MGADFFTGENGDRNQCERGTRSAERGNSEPPWTAVTCRRFPPGRHVSQPKARPSPRTPNASTLESNIGFEIVVRAVRVNGGCVSWAHGHCFKTCGESNPHIEVCAKLLCKRGYTQGG